MSFWSDFRKSLTGDKDSMEKIVDRLSPWNIGKRAVQQNVKDVLTGTKFVAEAIPEPIKKGLGAAASQIGKGITAPFQALNTQIMGGPSGGVLAAGAKIGVARQAAQVSQGLSKSQEASLNSFLKDGMADYAAQTAAEAVIPFDPLLQVAIKLEENVFSPLVKRPISTAALLTDPESPLFEDDAYGKGIQLNDIQTAYNRSKDVSLGVALTKSYLNPFHITGISDVILEDGYTKEEYKIMNESRKILGIPDLRITATAVRVPVFYGHAESVHILRVLRNERCREEQDGEGTLVYRRVELQSQSRGHGGVEHPEALLACIPVQF
jgi:hypothetical protein